MKKILLLLTILFNISFNSAYSADPAIKWKTIDTPHFKIIHSEKQLDIAKLYAKESERAYQALSNTFSSFPKKITMLINDSTDQANAFATSVPYPFINIFPVLPGRADSIYEYGNWAFELVIHELSHILTFEPANGIFKPLNLIFGSIAHPTYLLPRWYHEGLSVSVESIYSNFGRLRSNYFWSTLRALSYETSLKNYSIDKINTSNHDYLGGSRPYFFGSLLMYSILGKNNQEESIKNLSQWYGGRVPYFINKPVYKLTNKNYTELYDKALKSFIDIAKKQISIVSQNSTKNLEEPLTNIKGYNISTPQVSPNGKWLAYISSKDNTNNFIVLRSLNEQISNTDKKKLKDKIITSGKKISRISWTSDSQKILFDTIKTHKRHYSFADLSYYELKSKKVTRLTFGARASEAHTSPDLQNIIFRQSGPGFTNVAVRSLKDKLTKILLSGKPGESFSYPTFINNNEFITIKKEINGKQVILKHNISSKLTLRILPNYTSPQYLNIFEGHILFTSDKNGIPNLYSAKLTNLNQAKAITNITTGIKEATFSSQQQEYIYSKYDDKGSSLYKLHKSNSFQKDLINSPQLINVPKPKIENFALKPLKSFSIEKKDYSALPYLIPRYWMPYVGIIDGGYFFQASTASTDPVGNHSYSLSAFYDTLTKKPGYMGSYTNNTSPLSFGLGILDYYNYLYSFKGIKRSKSYVASLGSFIFGLSNNWRFNLSGHYSEIDIDINATNSIGLKLSGPSISISYNNVSQKGHDISPMSGKSFSLGYTKFLKSLSDLDFDEIKASGSAYWSRWLPKRHALALNLNAIYAPNNPRAATSFLTFSSTTNGRFQTTLESSNYMLRGYSSGTFLASSLAVANLEYRLPLWYIYSGKGTWPIYIKRIHAGIFTDAAMLEGDIFNSNNQSPLFGTQSLENFDKVYLSHGIELRFDLTLGNYGDGQFILGGYYGANKDLGGEIQPFISFIF